MQSHLIAVIGMNHMHDLWMDMTDISQTITFCHNHASEHSKHFLSPINP